MQFYVKDIMSEDVISIHDNETIKQLVDVFAEAEVQGVPVVDDDGYVVGVVSATDVIKDTSSYEFYQASFIKPFLVKFSKDEDFMKNKVSTIMTARLFYISPEDTVAKMAKLMYENKIHRLLVIDNKKLVGIVSTFDLLKLIATSDEEFIV